MECGIVFFILIFVIIVAVAFATNAQQRTALNDAYTKLANRFQGSIETAGTFSGYPSVRFMHNAAHVLVDVHSTGGEDATYYTQFHISWPDRNLRCEIYPERFMSRVGKLMGMQDIQIGSPQFDPNYIITGNDEGAIRELLTPTVQAHVDRLRRMFDRDDIYLSIGGGILLVKKRNILRSYSDLMQFTSASLELFEQALGSRTTGIEFIEGQRDPAVDEIVCQICGEDIKQDTVYCRSCRTPHHHDCWEYYGACSTYGCGEKKFVVAKTASRRAS